MFEHRLKEISGELTYSRKKIIFFSYHKQNTQTTWPGRGGAFETIISE